MVLAVLGGVSHQHLKTHLVLFEPLHQSLAALTLTSESPVYLTLPLMVAT